MTRKGSLQSRVANSKTSRVEIIATKNMTFLIRTTKAMTWMCSKTSVTKYQAEVPWSQPGPDQRNNASDTLYEGMHYGMRIVSPKSLLTISCEEAGAEAAQREGIN